jgi:hypothetical protein
MLQRSNSDVKSGAFSSSVWTKNEKFVTCWGIRNQAFRTPNREIISVSQVQFERLSCETPRAYKSVFIFPISSFNQVLSSIAE